MIRRDQGSYLVLGPGIERRALTLGMGIALAQTLANQRRKEAGSFTIYVKNALETITYAIITKEEDGTITTRPKIAA